MRINIQITLFFILSISQIAMASSIVGSKHDLSVGNYYGTYAGASTEICVFCHTPHSSNDGIEGPIWNRRITDSGSFTLYRGSSGLPNSPTIVCLSCHDGVSSEGVNSAVALFDTHNLVNNPGPGHANNNATPNCNACHYSGDRNPDKSWQIGPDLTNDHPVSVIYPNAKPAEFQNIPLNGLKLFNGMVECASCHNVHDPSNGTFLRYSNSNNASGLCLSCHIK